MKIKIVTDYPLAVDSMDFQHPLGTKLNNFCPAMVNRLVSLKEDPRVLDLGCAGGGFVCEMIDRGYVAVGIDGTEHPKTSEHSSWHRHPENFFTADITKTFSLWEAKPNADEIAFFNVITAFEVLEHIRESELQGLFSNIGWHATPDAICVFTVSSDASHSDGVELHVTKQSREWWTEFFDQQGWQLSSLQDQFEEPGDWCGWIGNSTMHFVLERDS